MEKTFRYTPQNVCSRQIEVVYDGDIVKKVTFVGGCPGNTQGVGRLSEGHTLDELISLLEGIRCPGSRTRDTSCPDQLAKALKAIKAGE